LRRLPERTLATRSVIIRARIGRFAATSRKAQKRLIGARSAGEAIDAIRLRAHDIPAALRDSLAAASGGHGMNDVRGQA
jgi:hypothetical protein